MEGRHPPPRCGMLTVRIGRGADLGARPTSTSPAALFYGLARMVHSSALHNDLQHHRMDAFQEGAIFARAFRASAT
eukprot:8971439-Alexandrium_andersonii.AAC.1